MIDGVAPRLCDALPEAVFLVDAQDGVVRLANRRAARMLGRPAGDIVGRPLLEFLAAGGGGPALAYLRRCARTGEPLPGALRFATPSGTEPRQALGAAVRTDGGGGATLVFLRCAEPRRASRLFVELNERLTRLSEELSRRGRLQAELQRALDEREALLKEVHHRVRNNLQVIASFLNLQLRSVDSEPSRRVLVEAQTRIGALGLIHGQLHDQDDPTGIDVARLLPELCDQLARTYGVPAEAGRVRFDLALAPWRLDLNRAVPLALLVTEAVTNALRHAFPVDAAPGGGTVAVELRARNGSRVLRIADDGVGLPAGMRAEARRSLGWRLMHAMADQLDAGLEIRADGGLGRGVEVRVVLDERG